MSYLLYYAPAYKGALSNAAIRLSVRPSVCLSQGQALAQSKGLFYGYNHCSLEH